MTTRGWTLKITPDGRVEVDRLVLDGPFVFRREAERAAKRANGERDRVEADGYSGDELEAW